MSVGVKGDEDDQPDSSVSVPGDSNAERDSNKENVEILVSQLFLQT